MFLFAFSVAVATAQQADPTALRNQVALLEVPPLEDTAHGGWPPGRYTHSIAQTSHKGKSTAEADHVD